MISHPYFTDINWESLASKQIPPPYKPPQPVITEAASHANLDAMLKSIGKDSWISTNILSNDDQKQFAKW